MARIWIALLLAAIALAATVTVFAQSRTVETTAAVDVTVWKHAQTEQIYLSTRPADGRWTTHNTPVDLTTLSASGNFYQGSAIRVDVPVTVEVDAPAETPPVVETLPDVVTLDPDMERANVWVYLWNSQEFASIGEYPLRGSLIAFADFDAFTLDVHVTSGRRAGSFCNANPIRSDIVAELGCTGLRDVSHTAIDAVWLDYDGRFGDLTVSPLTYSCIRHNRSTASESVWACLIDE